MPAPGRRGRRSRLSRRASWHSIVARTPPCPAGRPARPGPEFAGCGDITAGMDEPGQRVGHRRPAGSSGGGGEHRGAPSEAALRRLIAAWASDVQQGVPGDEEEPERPALDRRLLICEIGGGAFAFPLAAVTEVVPYTPPRRLPGQPADAGVTMLRGRRPLPTLDGGARD